MTLRIEDPDALDLLVRGGRVVDPTTHLDARLDVGVRFGRIVALEPDLSERAAARRTSAPMDLGTIVIDASNKIVAPGFVDLHTHVYVGVCGLTVPADESSSVSGVTTVASAGDAGAHTIEGFRRLAVEGSRTRVLAFLHVSSVGLAPWPAGEATDLDLLDVPAGVRAIAENADLIVGVKVRMGAPRIIGQHGLEPLRRAVAIAESAELPVMMHIGNCPRPIGDLLDLLRPGDIVTHCYAGSGNTLIEDGRVAVSAWAARRRGVLFDVGHGNASFDFGVAELAIREGFWPDTISTDIHALSAGGPAFGMPTTMSKFLALGMSLPEVLSAVTARPAAAISRVDTIGALALGRAADIAVFEIEHQPLKLVDAAGVERTGAARVRVDYTIRAGIPWIRPLPYPGRGVGMPRP
jgi:dihydroorotase